MIKIPKHSIALHLGVHKTGSTYVTHMLKNNEDLLNNHKISVIRPRDLRKNYRVTPLVRKAGADDQGQRESLCELKKRFDRALDLSRFDRFIVTEENFLGICSDWKGASCIYPKAEGNLGMVCRALADYNLQVFMAIRNFKTFLPSLYCEYLRTANQVVSFRAFIKNYNFAEINWCNFVLRVSKVFPKAEIKVWDFESLYNPDLAQTIFGKLAGDESITGWILNGDAVNSSICNQGIELLLKSHNEITRNQWRELRKYINYNKTWTVGDRFAPWSNIEADFFDQKHVIDTEQIAKLGGNIEFIK